MPLFLISFRTPFAVSIVCVKNTPRLRFPRANGATRSGEMRKSNASCEPRCGHPHYKKVKFTLEQAAKVQLWSEKYSSTLSLTSALDLEWVFNATPRPLYTREGPGPHCSGGLGGPQGRSGRVW